MNRTKLVRKILKLQKEDSYTSRVLDKLGGRVLDTLVYNMMEDENFDVKKFFQEQKKIHDTLQLEKRINDLGENRMSGEINGETIDGFSAFMVSRVLNQLTQEQKIHLLSKPTNEIVAIAYKLASRSEV